MNLKNIEKLLRKELNTKRNLAFEYEYENDNINASCDLTSKSYKGGIYAVFTVYTDGLILCSFTFDKIQLDHTSLDFITKFNQNSVWLTAYVTDKGYLKLRNNIFVGSENAVIENINFLLDHLITEKIKQYLSPLSQLTYHE